MLSRLLTRREQLILLAFAGSIVLGAAAVFYHHAHKTSTVASPLGETWPVHRQPTLPEVPEEAARPLSVPRPEGVALARRETRTEEDLASLTVSVVGAVRRPEVYRFEGEARVQDAIDRAGGAAEYADLSDINLAAFLIDGTTLHVPTARTAHIAGGRLIVRGGNAPLAANPPQYTVSGWRVLPEPPPSRRETGAQPAGDAGSKLVDLNRADAKELEALPGIGPVLAGRIIEYRELQPFRSVDDLLQVKGIGPKTLEAIRPLVTVR